jgi:hypothetical protein
MSIGEESFQLLRSYYSPRLRSCYRNKGWGGFKQLAPFLCPSRRAFAKAALVDESYDAFAGYVMRRCMLPSGARVTF